METVILAVVIALVVILAAGGLVVGSRRKKKQAQPPAPPSPPKITTPPAEPHVGEEAEAPREEPRRTIEEVVLPGPTAAPEAEEAEDGRRPKNRSEERRVG
jgi:fused signal recognition particle receptor